MKLPIQIRVQPTARSAQFGANFPESMRAQGGVTPQGDPRCSNAMTRCPTNCGPNGKKYCTDGRNYFWCDC